MNYTNKLGLPEPITIELARDDYSRGPGVWRSVTQLIDSPRKVLLYEKHDAELEEDVSDRLWLLMGKVIHEILEKAGTTGIREKRFFIKVGDRIISGATDHICLESKTLTDYKVSSVWTVKKGGREEWQAQLNLYRLLAMDAGHDVNTLRVAVICRDWRPGESKREAGYPPAPFVVLPITVWSEEETRRYLKERVALHLAAEMVQLPHCTSEERWKKPDQWALMKMGRKSAVFLYDSPQNAYEEFHPSGAKNHWIEHRPGEPTKCLSYCAAKRICQQLNDGQWTEEEMKSYGISA